MPPQNAQRKVENAQKTFFYERPDGTIFAVQEKEAWNIAKNRNQIAGVRTYPPKLIGTGDGTRFQKAVQDAVALEAAGKPDEARARLLEGEQEELEAARGTVIHPRNMDKAGDGAYLI
jgi:hypothetical protein